MGPQATTLKQLSDQKQQDIAYMQRAAGGIISAFAASFLLVNYHQVNTCLAAQLDSQAQDRANNLAIAERQSLDKKLGRANKLLIAEKQILARQQERKGIIRCIIFTFIVFFITLLNVQVGSLEHVRRRKRLCLTV